MKGFGMFEVDKVGWLEHEKPTPGPNDAILRPLMVAPCSSDVHMSHGGSGPVTDMILGHESVGEVVEVGELVTQFKPGDICVVPCCTPHWGGYGTQERFANNAHDTGLMHSFKFLQFWDGVFAEYYKVNDADANLVLKPEQVSMEDCLMTTDMMSTGFYGAEMANIHYGDNVVVFGIGPVGLMAIAGAALAGAAHVIGIGTRPNCAALAREYGATEIVSYKDGDLVEQCKEITHDHIDSCIIAGGNTGSVIQALTMVKPNGTISNVNYWDASAIFQVPAPLLGLGMNDVTMKGGFCPGGGLRIAKLLNLIENDRVHPGKLLNYKYEGFDKIPEAFQVMDEKPRDLIKPCVKIYW